MAFWKLYYHLVWATKNRLSLITPEMEGLLFAFLTAKARQLECTIDAINGMEDHIHLVISIPPKYSVAEIVQRLKGASSHDFPDLIWQRSYGVLSLGQSQRKTAIAYVNNQKEHHKHQTTNHWLEKAGEDEKE